MKKILLLLTLLSFFMLTSCELFMEEPIQGKVYYVTVGIDYKNNGTAIANVKNDLDGTIHDAQELYDALEIIIGKAKRESTGYTMIQEGDQPEESSDSEFYLSKTKIETQLTTIKNSANENDLTIFTYSGHGIEETGHLVLAYSTTGYETLSPDELLSWMAAIPGKKLVILDSCFSGMFVDKSPSSTNTIFNNSITKFFETYHSSDKYGKPDLYVLTASAHTDSYEAKFGTGANAHVHGIFTYALLEALGWNHTSDTAPLEGVSSYPPAAKNGRITVDGLFRYIKKNQAISTKLALFSNWGEFQHPLTTGGPLDLVLFNL